jgi:hypothetical protein
MITRHDLDERIAEIKNKRDQTETEGMKLAAFLIIRKSMDEDEPLEYTSPAPLLQDRATETIIGKHGDSDFLLHIAGKNASDVWAVIDEAMSALKLNEPRMYAGVMRKIQ